MKWHERYLSLPFKAGGRSMDGADCYGLVYLVLSHRGCAVPVHGGEYSLDVAETSSLLADGIKADCWRRVEIEKPFDVAVFKRGAFPADHVGIVVRPRTMLHTQSGDVAHLENYRTRKWERRLVGFYRHEALS
ncbi:NlpC/P60 family protein [Notoacmeibacter sp. MSK16QG-6]|uniref:NlpC/P60 family protein n=1 Tax=Notoacmeibacter sp. MSK16QG-6 TaxID=2957982 RepID=UPI00209F275A|nr:NlpC/P60 family protein [Notoacmeibacter sp. MSK16QG-6]MCP1200047.1 C40 family peptidase [Notoacmeibacter sp. MSK16QG-6]